MRQNDARSHRQGRDGRAWWIALLLIGCFVASFLATHTVSRLTHNGPVARPVAHEGVFHRKAAASLVVGGRPVLGATAYQPYVQFYDSFEGLHTASEIETGGLFPQDANWLQTGTNNNVATANRDAQSSEMALGGNQYPVSSTVSPAGMQPVEYDIAPGGPSAFLNANGKQTGMYQVPSASWATHPLAISFSADWGWQGGTTALLMTPDDNITATNSLTNYVQEPNYLGLISTGNGNLHLQERTAGGTPTDLVPAFPALQLNDEQRDYRLVITGTSTTAATVSVQQYQGMDQRMEAGYSTFPNDWFTLATTTMTYPTAWTSHVHLWMSTTTGQAAFGRVAEVDPTTLPTYDTPAILSHGGIDPSVDITYTTPGANDPTVVGYVARWYTGGAYVNQKYTMWAGQGKIQANGINPSLTYTMTVAPVYVGGYVGPASAPITTTSTSNAAYRTQFNGFFDDFTNVTETNSMALDPALYDLSQSYIDSSSSPGFIMARHWMENIRLADNFTGARGGDAQRIRTPFDITNRTGTFQTEIDLHAYNRSWWDLDFVPTFITSNRLPDEFHDTCCAFPSLQPADYLQLTFVGSGQNGHFALHFRKGGDTSQGTNHNYGKQFSPPFSGVPDLRNLLVVKLSSSLFQLYLDGNLFWTVPINIANTAYNVSINHVPYHTDIEGDVERSEFHYANTGFDAPAGTVEPIFTPVYAPGCQPGQEPTDGCNNQDYSDSTFDGANIHVGMQRTFQVTVPTTATQATAATFTAIAEKYPCSYGNFPVASVGINGNGPIPLYVPTGSNACGSGSDHTTVTATVPVSYFVPGVNNIQIIKNSNPSGTNGFHMGNEEVEFSMGGYPVSYNPLTASPIVASMAATNTVQQINLAPLYNEVDILNNGSTAASTGFDGTFSGRAAYSAQDLASKGYTTGTTASFQGVNYTIPPATGNNGLGAGAGSTIPVSATAAAMVLNVLGAESNGPQGSGLTITYMDGTVDSSQSLNFADWCSSAGANAISSPIVRVAGADGTTNSGACNIYGAAIQLQQKPVKSITLSANGNTHILAMSLSGPVIVPSTAGAAANTIAQVSLTSAYNEADILNSGSTAASTGFDGTASYRSAYGSASLGGYGYTTGGTGVYNNVVYAIPAAGTSSGINAAGQTITFNASTVGSSLNFLGASSSDGGDNAFDAGPLTITYADGTKDSTQVMGFPNWCGGSPGINAISPPIARINGVDGTVNGGSCSIFPVSVPLQNKAVTSVTLPNNSSVHILSMSVSGSGAVQAATSTPTPVATATPTPIPGAITLYTSQIPASTSASTSALGTRFQSSQAGAIYGIRVYRAAGETGASHAVALYDSAGTQLATATTANEASAGWYTATFATPVSIAANTVYVAAYTANATIAYTTGGFPLSNGALSSATGSNGVYGAANAYPSTASTTGNSYFVDPIFAPVASPTNTPTNTATPTPAPTETALPAPSGISAAILGLHVSGSQLLNGQGQPVVLHGINRDGSEYMCAAGSQVFDGPSDSTSVGNIANWTTTISGTTTTAHLTAVRVPLNEDCWLGLNGAPMGGTTATQYRSAIAAYVTLLQQNGLVPILSLQAVAPGANVADGTGSAYSGANTMPMPDANHSPDFWSSVAATFKGNSGVLFDLFNEFHPDNNADSVAAWTCIRDGGTCNGVNYQAAGTQTLVNAIRAAGATNVLLLGGAQYNSHLDQWATYKPTDPQTNLLASWHLYDNQGCTQSCWDAQLAGVGSNPTLVGEVGETDCAATTFLNPYTTYLDGKGIGYLAWAWDTYNCSSFPSLITAYTGAATTYGQGYHDHLVVLAAPPPIPYPTVAALQTQVAVGQATVQAQATQIAYDKTHGGGKGSGPIHRGR